MTESELELYPPRPVRRLHTEWILPVLYRPGRTLRRVLDEEQAVWSTPLLLLTLLAIVLVLVTGPVRAQAAQATPAEPPADFQYWTPEMQQQFMDSQAKSSSPVVTYVFPAIGAIAGLWIIWLLFGSILHLGLTLNGSRSTSSSALNLVAWASIPIALRLVVQIVYTLATKQLITDPGLSGLSAATVGFPLFLKLALAAVDLYVLWRLVLILAMTPVMSGLPKGRAWTIVLVTFLLILALQALPGFLGAKLSGLEMIRPFFF